MAYKFFTRSSDIARSKIILYVLSLNIHSSCCDIWYILNCKKCLLTYFQFQNSLAQGQDTGHEMEIKINTLVDSLL